MDIPTEAYIPCCFDPRKRCVSGGCSLYRVNLVACEMSNQRLIDLGLPPMTNEELIFLFLSTTPKQQAQQRQRYVDAWGEDAIGCPNFDPRWLLLRTKPLIN